MSEKTAEKNKNEKCGWVGDGAVRRRTISHFLLNCRVSFSIQGCAAVRLNIPLMVGNLQVISSPWNSYRQPLCQTFHCQRPPNYSDKGTGRRRKRKIGGWGGDGSRKEGWWGGVREECVPHCSGELSGCRGQYRDQLLPDLAEPLPLSRGPGSQFVSPPKKKKKKTRHQSHAGCISINLQFICAWTVLTEAPRQRYVKRPLFISSHCGDLKVGPEG